MDSFCGLCRRTSFGRCAPPLSESRATARRPEKVSKESLTFGGVNEGEGEIRAAKRDPEKGCRVAAAKCPGSKSNTAAGEIDFKKACQKLV